MYADKLKIDTLVGKALVEVIGEVGSDELLFVCDDGKRFKMYHDQDCCETVRIEEIHGDLADLIGSPILAAEESTNNENPPKSATEYGPPDSFTWTFYRLTTIKGSAQIRWYGESNGYYSESVSFVEVL